MAKQGGYSKQRNGTYKCPGVHVSLAVFGAKKEMMSEKQPESRF